MWRGIDLDLPEMSAGGADCIACHDVVDHIGTTLGNTPIQTYRAICVEGLSFETEVMRADLGQIAAQGMASNGHFGSRLTSLYVLLFCIVQCPPGELDRIGRLRILARQDHATVSQYTVLH